MNYLERWQQALPAAIEHAVACVSRNVTIGPGLLAAVALWPLRADVQASESAAIDTVRDVVGPGAGRVLRLVSTWGDDLLMVANDLNSLITADTDLEAACKALEARFSIVTQLAARIATRFTPNANTTNFQDAINAAMLNIGSTVNIDAYTIQIHVPAPDPETQLAAALSRLDQLPLDRVPTPASLPTPHRMPHRYNPQFVGRDDDLKALAALLKAQHTTVIVAATGLGGVGKTQLASELVHRYGQFFWGGVFWVDASSEAVLRTEIAACGESGVLDLPGFAALHDLDTRVARVLAEWGRGLPRLLVFDNLEDPALLQLAPTTGGCRVLLTARRTTWSGHGGVQTHALDVLDRVDSLHLLLRSRYRNKLPTDSANAEAICEALGDLPLALTLAGAFLEAAPSVTLSSYLRQIAGETVQHASLNTELEEQLPTKHVTSIVETFRLSYEQLLAEQPTINALAVILLHRAAQCAPTPIPRRLLIRAGGYNPDEGQPEVDAALRRLVGLGLLAELDAPDADTAPPLRLHRLLAAYVRERTAAPAENELAVEEALSNEMFAASTSGASQLWQPYLEHALHWVPTATRRADETAATLLNNLSGLLDALGDYDRASLYLEQSLTIRRSVLGEMHPDTAQSLNNLGALRQEQGNYNEARVYYEQALTIYQQMSGEQHLDVSMSLNNIGTLLLMQGDYAGAHPYLEQAFAIRQQWLGEMHPDTASSLGNLSALLQAQGKLVEARSYLERALAIRRHLLGEWHPDTAQSLANLGALLYTQGDYNRARSYLERALTIRRQLLGEWHPDTANSFSNLGSLLQAQGDLTGARPYYEQAVVVRRQVLGERHPDTATSLNNLGYLLQAQGDMDGAHQNYELALVIRQDVLSEMHPDTAKSLSNLGNLLCTRGDYNRAYLYLEQALAIHRHLLGEMHPDTAISLINLGLLFQAQGDYSAARSYNERALAINEVALDPIHPDMALSLNNLAVVLACQEKFGEAARLMRQALAIREQALGTNHPDTQSSRDSLAAIEAILRGDPLQSGSE